MTRHRASAFSLALCWAGLIGCANAPGDPSPPDGPLTPAFRAFVSDPGEAPDPAAPGQSPAAGGVVYVSVAPGTIPNGSNATIENRRTGTRVTRPVVDGGFDPVAIPAAADDSIRIEVLRAGGGTPAVASFRVPPAKGLFLVRTSPPRGKRDVSLNPSLTIVFSEPVDAATVTDQSVMLRKLGVPVAGSAVVDAAAPWTVRFTPAVQLESETTYELTITTAVRDQDGEPLAAGVSIEFTTEAMPPLTPSDAQLAFVSTRDGGGPAMGCGSIPWIYLARADGSNATRFTRGQAPAWSPDGARLAFHRSTGSGAQCQGDTELVVWDGAAFRVLAQGGFHPSFAPDGRSIVYNTGVGVPNAGIHVVDVDGPPDARKLIDYSFALPDDGYGPGWVGFPVWSPDGGRIAFVRANYGIVWTMFVMNADGSDPMAVSLAGGMGDTPPSWSPDGSLILAMVHDAVRGWSIASFDPAGSNLVHHVQGPWAADPDWSPDGSHVVFAAFSGPPTADAPVGSRARIYIKPVGSGSPAQLVPEATAPVLPDYWDTEPAWSRVAGAALRSVRTGNR